MSKFDYDPHWENNQNLREACIIHLLCRFYPLNKEQCKKMIKEKQHQIVTPPNKQLFAFLTNQISLEEMSHENKTRWSKLKGNK